MRELTGFLLTAMLLACNNAPGEGNEVDTLKVDSVATASIIPSTACFEDTTKGNRIYLSLKSDRNEAQGGLDYAIAEKDKNTGTFKGVFSGDTLTAEYSFNAEGRKSVRQIKFLIRDSAAIEGYGKMEQTAGKMIFSKDATISFAKGIVLKRVECKH